MPHYTEAKTLHYTLGPGCIHLTCRNLMYLGTLSPMTRCSRHAPLHSSKDQRNYCFLMVGLTPPTFFFLQCSVYSSTFNEAQEPPLTFS